MANESIISFKLTVAAQEAMGELSKASAALKGLGASWGAAADEAKTSMQQLASAFGGVRAPMTSAKESADAFREALDLSDRMNALRASLDPAYGATLRFEQAQTMAAEAVRLGAVSEAEAKATLDTLAAKLGMAGDATMKFAGAQDVAARSAHANVAVVGNVASQFQDIGVMLAAGQNPFTLALQQGTQLSAALTAMGGGARGAAAALKAGFLSLLSPVSLLTIGIIAGGAALIEWVASAGNATSKAEDLKRQVDALTASIGALRGAETAAAEPFADLVRKYGDLARAVREARQELASDAFQKAKADLAALMQATNIPQAVPLADVLGLDDTLVKIDALRKKMADAAHASASGSGAFYDDTADSAALTELTRKAQAVATFIGAIRDQFHLSQEAARGLTEAISRLGDAQGPKAQVEAAQALRQRLVEVFGSAEEANKATGGMVTALAEAVNKGADLASIAGEIGGTLQGSTAQAEALGLAFGAAKDAAEGLASVDLVTGLTDALAPAAALAAKLWDAAEAKASIAATTPPLRGPAGRGDPVTPDELAGNSFGYGTPDTGGSGGGRRSGGGGSSVPTVASIGTEAKRTLDSLDLAIGAINEKVKAGLMSAADAEKAIADEKGKAADAVAGLIAEVERLGPTGALVADQLRQNLVGLASDLSGAVSDLSKTLAEGFTSPFKDFIKGTISAGEAFDRFGDSILDKMLEIAAKQAEANVIAPLFAGLFGSIGGGGFGEMIAGAFGGKFAKGGAFSNQIVSQPTAFGMPGGKIGIMGEAGPEAIMPLKGGRVRAVLGAGKEAMLALTRAADGSLAVKMPPLNPALLGQIAAFAKGGTIGGESAMRMETSPARERPSSVAGPTINITPPIGHEAVVTERGSGLDRTTDIVFEAVGARLAGDLRSGRGPLASVLQDTFGLKRQTR